MTGILPGVTLSPTDLKHAFLIYSRLLASHRQGLNALNVYPVPDGDTGSNMAQTVDSVVRHLDEAETMDEVAGALSHGSLMGAAGNSGVILSQVLRGLADVVRPLLQVETADLATALSSAATAAYEAVQSPVEGTILTVVRESATAAQQAADGELAEMLRQAYERAVTALESTTEMLPVLKEARVVDAGGAGYLLLLAAFLEVVTGVEVALPEHLFRAIPTIEVEGAPIGPRYEVMYFLEAPDERLDAFRRAWRDMGDSIVVVGGDGLWNCHIHTDEIGPAVEAGIEAGRPRGIRITDLYEQVGALEADVAAGGFSPLPEFLTASIGVVAVATGPGLVERFRRLGVQQVVAGGQSANPTVEEVLAAVEEAPAGAVIILPNNKNIIPVAEQVDGLTTKTVAVVPTRSLTQGLAAMMGYVPDAADLDSLLDDMAAAAGAVDFGEVTMAVRDARVDGWDVNRGDWMGVADGRIVVADQDRFSVLRGLVAAIMPPTAELVTVYAGEGATTSDAKALEAWVAETHPRVEVLSLEGGQPLYPYLISVE